MNARSFKVIFSKRLGALVAVGENATAQGKSASGEASHSASGLAGAASSAAQHVGVLKHICLAALLGSSTQGFALDANALPTGAVLHHGTASVGTEGATMTINQTSSRATINWQSFNVGEKARVNVVQNNSQSVLLNRVVGNEMSQIRGQISANGQVVLVNPNGIVMGPTGRITASAFTASTFGITDANFQAGHMKYERNGSTGQIVHQGHIQTAEAGGYVALIGADVNNQGTITTRQGAVVLAAADAVTLPSIGAINNVSVPLSSKVRLELNPDSFGSASVSNSGVIVTDGGQVLMRAAAVVDAVSKIANASVLQSGSIDTSGVQGGGVDILADHGRIRVSGSVKANSTNGTAGGDVYIGRDQDTNVLAAIGDVRGAILESKGGFVETSGQFLATYGTRVLAKDWLLDPSDITISNSASSNVTGTSPDDITPTGTGTSTVQVSTIVGAINQGTNVTIKTTNDSNPNGAGNITIADALNFNNTGLTDATLSLIADNGITQNAAITATGSKLVHIKMESKGQFRGLPGANANSQGMTLNRAITTNGDVTLRSTVQNTGSSNAITFNNGSGITANKYTVVGTQNGTANSSQGIVFSGTTSFNQTGDGHSSVRGTTRGGSWPPSMGIYYLTGSNTTFDSGTGTTQVVGKLEGFGSSGTRTGFIGGANITTKGNVTLGSNEQGATFFHRAGTIKAESGTLNIIGSSIETYDPTSRIEGANGTTINLSAPSIRLGSTAGGSSQIAPTSGGSGFTLNIAADSLVVQPGSVSNSGAAGTTTIKNFNSATRIDLGGADVASTISTPATLGLSSAEIASFTAGNLIFGGDTAGDLVVSAAISLNKIRITSNGNIDINAALTATTTKPEEFSDAIVIVAGKDKHARDSTGGNIKIGNGGAINVLEQGGVAKLFTGSITGTTGISGIAASGSGKFRYNSDETTANFTKELGKRNGTIDNGVNIIYREAPEITVTANSTSSGVMTYNGSIQADLYRGATNNIDTAGVLKNGDSTSLSGDLQLAYAKGTETVLKNAGTYTVKASGLTNDLGYKVKFDEGSLVIDPKIVQLTGSRVYDGTTGMDASNLKVDTEVTVDGKTEVLSLTGSGQIASKNVITDVNGEVQSRQLSSIGTLLLGNPSGDSANNTIDGLASNYVIGVAQSNVKIAKQPIAVKGLTAENKTFDNSTVAQWSGAAELDGKVAGDSLSLNVSAANFNSPDVGNNKPVTLTGVLDGVDKGNYTLVLPVLAASITNSVEPVVPPTPVVPVTPPSNSNVVVSVAAASNNFQLAGAEGQCSADALEECECESASSPAGEVLDGIQICFASGSSAKE